MQRQRIAQQAQRSPAVVCNHVVHVIDRDLLLAAYRLPRKTSPRGATRWTATPSAEPLEANRRDLHERLRDHR